MVAPVVAPYVPTYASYTPYITAADFLAEPTGVDVSQLIPSGSGLTEEAALERLVANASSEADRICQKVLAATLDVVSGEYRVWRDGTIRVPVPYSPLISVNAVSIGFSANGMTAMGDLSGIRLTRNVARIPAPLNPPLSLSFNPNPAAYAQHGWVFADVSCVSGWAHSVLSAAATVGAQQITPGNVLGFLPGLPFTVYDGQSTEAAQVAANYVVGSAVVPLAAPLRFAHDAGVTVSALPPFARLAVVTLAKWLAKTKGTKAIVMPSISGRTVSSNSGPKTQTIEPGGSSDYKQAERDLLTLKRSR